MFDTLRRVRASVYIATSLDGYIARTDGSLDWLPGAGESDDDVVDATGEDYGYAAFMADVDCLVMGRLTYEKVRGFGDWPYDKPVFVLATGAIDIPEVLSAKVESLRGEPDEILDQLATRGFSHAYLDGGVTIQRFLAAGRVDRLIVTTIPVLLGSGRPLFGPLPADVPLEHVETRAYPAGLVQSQYRVRCD